MHKEARLWLTELTELTELMEAVDAEGVGQVQVQELSVGGAVQCEQ